jgi:putative SOS response-associated peptidase YedK
MCYSATIEGDLREYERAYGAALMLDSFAMLFRQRVHDDSILIPKCIELAFESPRDRQEAEIKQMIVEYRTRRTRELEQEIFKQKSRLATAERRLRSKATQAVLDELRVATYRIEKLVGDIRDVNRTDRREEDRRIFPFYYAPIVIDEGTGRHTVPARYHCRPAGKPAAYDREYDGSYAAARPSLQDFWRAQYGKTHGILRINSFYETVNRHKYEQRALVAEERTQDLTLVFSPRPHIPMHVPCIWSRWDRSLLSFAIVTDRPSAEIVATGVERCPIALRRASVERWLDVNNNVDAFQQALDECERPYYQHQRLSA